MAVLKLENGKELTDLSEIQAVLNAVEVNLAHWPIDRSGSWSGLLDKASLNEDEKNEILKGSEKYFNELREEEGYQTQDLIVLNPEIEGLDDLLAKFDKVHTHDDDEVRYIVDGEGIFGFVLPDQQVTLKIQPEEYINVPAGLEHWFVLTDAKRIKAVRYFSGTEGWTPNYTETERKL